MTSLLQSTTVSLEVEVEDENDNSPQFTESVYQVAISENATVASSIIRVLADDPDHGGNGDVVFTLMGGDGVFAINKTSGELCFCKYLKPVKTSLLDKSQIKRCIVFPVIFKGYNLNFYVHEI